MANNNGNNGNRNGNKNGFPWDYVLIGLGLGTIIWLVLRPVSAKYGLGQNIEISPRRWAGDFRIGGEISFPQSQEQYENGYHNRRRQYYGYDDIIDSPDRRLTIS